MDKRLEQLTDWVNTVVAEPIVQIAPASADASFRRYFRVITSSGSKVVMDAPPDKEQLQPFVEIAQALRNLQVHAPEIFAHNDQLGFLLMEDLGERPYLAELASNHQILYQDALGALLKIQQGSVHQPDFKLPDYDEKRLHAELDLFEDWYLRRHLDQSLSANQHLIWQDTKELLVVTCRQQPQVWVHRDYHSRNLMIDDHDNPGVIDFQDMVLGPISYDLASIFKDCYIEWPRQQQLDWLDQYHQHAQTALPELSFTLAQLVRWYDLTGLQRHLKVLGIFCRLNYRDQKDQYMSDLPLVKKYIEEVLQLYPELRSFQQLFNALPHSC